MADLKAVSDAKGATVYKDHLPLLGESVRAGGSLAGTSTLAVGDQVQCDQQCDQMWRGKVAQLWQKWPKSSQIC